MKEKMPITSTTPVPTPSAAIAAEAHESSASVAVEPKRAEPAATIDVSRQPNLEPSAGQELDAGREPKMSADDVSVFYGDKQALKDISIRIYDDRVTAFIGPSGCGKSTFLRCLNRMNDTISSARVTVRI